MTDSDMGDAADTVHGDIGIVATRFPQSIQATSTRTPRKNLMRLTIASLNVKDGGGDRGHRQMERLATVGHDGGPPDVVLLQEVQGWAAKSHRRLFAAARELALDPVHVIPYGRSDKPTATLFNRHRMTPVALYTEMSAELYHGFMIVAFDVGLQQPLAVSSVHLTPYGAGKAVDEAQTVAIRLQAPSTLGVLGGDINHLPPDDPAPDYHTMPAFTRGTHTRHNTAPEPEGDHSVTNALRAHGLHDVARSLATTSTDSCPTGTGRYGRVDQFWVTPGLLPAITGYRSFDAASDHRGIAVDLDLTHAVPTENAWT